MSDTHKHTEKAKLKRFWEPIDKRVYTFYEFKSKYLYPVPAWFRRFLNRERRAKEKNALRNGRELPLFKRNASWLWW